MKNGLVLVLLLAVTLGVGAFGGMTTAKSVKTWYVDLAKPAFNPPAWVFGPVWTALYVLMAVAAWLVFRERSEKAVVLPLVAFGIQLALNAAWSFLFFGLKRPDLAFAEILGLLAAIAVTAILFRRVSGLAAALLLPYLAWVSFATALNFAIWRLNRG